MPSTKKDENKVKSVEIKKEEAKISKPETTKEIELTPEVTAEVVAVPNVEKAKKITLIASLSVVGLLIVAIVTLALVKVSTFPNIITFDHTQVLDVNYSVKNYPDAEVIKGEKYSDISKSNVQQVVKDLMGEFEKSAKQSVLTAMFEGNLGQKNLNDIESITDTSTMGSDNNIYEKYDYVVKIYLERYEWLKDNTGARIEDSIGNDVAYDVIIIALNSSSKTKGEITIIYNTVTLNQVAVGVFEKTNPANNNYKYHRIVDGNFGGFYDYVRDNIN